MDIELISRQPDFEAYEPHLLFVHGAFHGAWCWDEHFLPWFAARGWTAHALSLRGHGGSSGADATGDWSLGDYLQDIGAAIDRIAAAVVLVGHSMGGVLAQMARAARDDVRGAVLLASSPLRPSPSVMLRILFSHPIATIRGMAGDRDHLRRAMESFFFSPDLDPVLREKYRSLLSPESQQAMKEVFSRPPPGAGIGVPVLVVAGTEDWSIPMKDHEALSRAYDAPLVQCPGYHDLMLDPRWEESAIAINDWLGRTFG